MANVERAAKLFAESDKIGHPKTASQGFVSL